MVAKHIGFLIYPDIQALDVAGPMDAFDAAVIEDSKGRQVNGYEVFTIGLSAAPVTAESGLILQPKFTAESAPRMDTLVIPGGRGMRDPRLGTEIARWIERNTHDVRRIAAICTGVYGLAATGLLDGRSVTTHWRFADDLAKRFPALRVDPNALFLRDGRFYASAGITAGIDLSLALIEEDYGATVSLSVARELVVYLKRPGGQAQYSEPLQFDAQSPDRLADIVTWIRTNLHKTFSTESLARRACCCPRHFTRLFKQAFGVTPAAFVEKARMEEARRRLSNRRRSIERVAASVGYRSSDVFRRAFERQFGVSPRHYRDRFGKEPAPRERNSV